MPSSATPRTDGTTQTYVRSRFLNANSTNSRRDSDIVFTFQGMLRLLSKKGVLNIPPRCYLCPRTTVTYVPGLYTRERGRG